MGAGMQRIFSRSLCAWQSEWRRFASDETGAVLAFLVILPVLAGMVALGMETGKLYTIQRMMQNAADDAALAGSIDRLNGASIDTITTDARFETKRNGFTNGTNNVSVSVTVPTSGSYANTPGAVQVTVSQPQSFSFGNVLNRWLGQASTPAFTMSATSVAAQGTYTVTTQQTVTTQSSSADACLVALGAANEQGITFSNFSSFQSDCGVMSNALSTSKTSSGASVYIGQFSSASFKYVWSRGSFYATGFSSLTPNPNVTPVPSTVQTNQTTTITDPYANLTIPTLTTCNFTNYNPSWANPTIVTPGVYCGGLQVSSGGNVQFQPGTYYIANGDLYLSSSSSISCPTCTNGAGVTFILTQTTGNNANIGGVKITSDSTVSLSAPNSGPYKGILFYQDRNAPVGTMSSTSKIFTVSSISSATLNGAIYFPNNKIALSSYSNGSSSAGGCNVWVGRYLNLTSFSSSYVAGCKNNYNLSVPGIITTTTSQKTVTSPVTKARVMQ